MERAYKSGIAIAAAAGNARKDTTNVYPCAYTKYSVCVGSSDIDYKHSRFSNHGREVKIYAPGSEIAAASNTDDYHTTFKSGTSMASPVVAGIMATFVSFETIDDNVNKVWDRLVKNQIVGILSGIQGKSPNNFVNSGINSVLKHEHEPYFGAIPIGDHPSAEANAAPDGAVPGNPLLTILDPQGGEPGDPKGPENWELDSDADPDIVIVGVASESPDAVVAVTEDFTAAMETEGPNPDAEEDVGFEGSIDFEEEEKKDDPPPPPPAEFEGVWGEIGISPHSDDWTCEFSPLVQNFGPELNRCLCKMKAVGDCSVCEQGIFVSMNVDGCAKDQACDKTVCKPWEQQCTSSANCGTTHVEECPKCQT